MTSSTQRSEVSIVGVGHHRFGRHDPDLTGLAMGAQAIGLALSDAGINWSDIDYAVGGSNVSGKPDTLVSQLGLTGIPFVNVRNGCATGGVALATAANAIRAGEAEVALVVGFDKHARGAFAANPADYGHKNWYAETGLMITTQFFAMKGRRYLHEHNLKDRLLAQVAAKAFRCGELNPDAWRRTALTEDEILNARVINPPLTQYMFCSPSEGATAVVLARADRAADLCNRPVRLAAVTKRTRRFGSFEVFAPWLPPHAGVSPSVDAATAAFEKAGLKPSDVHVAQVQDTDAAAEIYHMAETGLCQHGEQQQLLDLNETAPTGRLPINTDGGCLANGEPVGASGLRQVREVVLQLQGRADNRQATNTPRVGFTHVYGAPGIIACTVLTTD
jgi:acetyl-CoA acetyltransferase